jgi:hypothetical protein
MRKLNSIHLCFVILYILIHPQLYGQQLPLKTFSLAADHFATTYMDGLQIDWRLDLGLTAMSLDQSSRYEFTAGFLQPSINRYSKEGLEEKYNPSIELRTSVRGDAIVLFSKEPDLILFGYTIYNLHGQVIMSDPTKYRSGYTGRQIDINTLSSGLYIMQVFYLHEFLSFDNKNNYWMKYIKLIKP